MNMEVGGQGGENKVRKIENPISADGCQSNWRFKLRIRQQPLGVCHLFVWCTHMLRFVRGSD